MTNVRLPFSTNTKLVSSFKYSFLTLLAVRKCQTKYLHKHLILGNTNLLRLKGGSTKNDYLLKGGSTTFLMSATVSRASVKDFANVLHRIMIENYNVLNRKSIE